MTGLNAFELLLEGKVARIRRKGDDDMTICIDEEGQLSLSVEYDWYITDNFNDELRWSPGAMVEHFYNDLLKDDWELVE